jgi:hypothetical protein
VKIPTLKRANVTETGVPSEAKKRTLVSSKKAAIAFCLLGLAAFAAWWFMQPATQPNTEVGFSLPATRVALPGNAAEVTNEPVARVEKVTPAKRKIVSTKKVSGQTAVSRPPLNEQRKEKNSSTAVVLEEKTVTAESKTPVELPMQETAKTDSPKEKKKLRMD